MFRHRNPQGTVPGLASPKAKSTLFSPNSLLLGVLNALKNGRLGAGMVWSGSRPACLSHPFICLPVLFLCLPGWVLVVSPTFICFPLLFMCLPFPFICPRWVLVVGFRAGLSPTSFHLSPTSFHLSPSSFHLRLGACGGVPGWLVSHFLSFVSNFFLFVSQAACLWSGSWLACLPSFHLSPRLGVCGRVPGWLVSHFLLFVSHFFSFVPAGLSPTSLICLPFPFNCLPVLFICLHTGCL